MADIILGALVLGPLIITVLLKSNAALSFLALAAGFAALSFASAGLEDLTGQLNFSINSSTLNLTLLGIPLVLTLLITRKSFHGKPKLIFHGLVALCAGGLLALIAVPLLTESVRTNFAGSDFWLDLQKIQASVVGAGVFLSLMLIWSDKLKRVPSKKHK